MGQGAPRLLDRAQLHSEAVAAQRPLAEKIVKLLNRPEYPAQAGDPAVTPARILPTGYSPSLPLLATAHDRIMD